MKSQIDELNDEVDSLRAQIKDLKAQVHEYRTRETITALTRYEGTGDAKGFLTKLLGEAHTEVEGEYVGDTDAHDDKAR